MKGEIDMNVKTNDKYYREAEELIVRMNKRSLKALECVLRAAVKENEDEDSINELFSTLEELKKFEQRRRGEER